MTDKRPGCGFQHQQPRSKIPKLDVSIVASSSLQAAGRPRTSSGFAAPRPPSHHANQVMRAPPPMQTRVPAPPASEDMWGDDDDDFIISQAAEKAENCNPQELLSELDASTTFGDFRRNHLVATSASTQLPAAPTAAAVAAGGDELTDDAVLREFRAGMGAEDDVFSEMPDFDEIDDVNKHIAEYLNNDQNTLVQQHYLSNLSDGSADSGKRSGGTAAATAKNGVVSRQPGGSGSSSDGGRGGSGGPTGATAHNKYMQNVENAREIRLKFLGAQLADKQRENEQLQRELTKLNERCQTKDGEIAMIRYDLQLNKKLQTDLRQDKLTESERIKSEYAAKLAELERTYSGHNAEMDFMRLEIHNLKSRRNHDTTLSSQHRQPPHPKTPAPQKTAAISASLFRLHLTETPSQPARAPSHLFQQLQTRPYGTYRPPNSLSDQLTTLQLLAAQLDTASTPADRQPLHAQILTVTERSLHIMQLDCDRLVACHTHATDGRPNNFVQLCDDGPAVATRSRLLAAASMSAVGELFDDESLPVGRRIVTCLAAVAHRSPHFCELLFSSSDPQTPVQRLTKMLRQIGVSTQWRQYGGLVEATADLLLACAQHYRGPDWRRPLQQLLHAVLLCRPSGRALGHIAGMLRTLSQGNGDFLSDICTQSGEDVLLLKEPRYVQFGVTSCSMQLLAVWLQAEFEPFAERWTVRQMRLLAELTLDVLRMLQNGADLPCEWMVRPPAQDGGGGGGGRREKMCRCYAQLVCAGVVLVHLCVQEWIRRPKEFANLKTIVAIAQAGCLFISNHFTLRYEVLVLNVGGPAIMQRLHVTFAWLQQFQKLLNFERVHEQALIGSNNLRGVPHMFEMLNNAGNAGHSSSGGGEDEALAAASSGSVAATGIWSEMLGAVRAWREAPTERDSNDSDDDLEPDY